MQADQADAHKSKQQPDEGVGRWCAAYTKALLGAEFDTCERLVIEAHDLPPAFVQLVATRIRPATGLLRGGNAARSVEMLTAGNAELGRVLSGALEAGPDGMAGQEDLHAALAHGLAGVWLDTAGSTEAAAASYFESGKHFGWLGDTHSQLSLDLLKRANALDPAHVATHWLLANAWFLRSSVDPSALQRSLEAWNRGAALQLPDAASSWAYVLRALINEEMARADDGNRISLWWEAVVFLERALLADDRDAVRWAHLGRLHRLLESESASLHATGQAFQRDPEDLTVLDERAAVLANTGAFEDALKAIEKRLGKDPANAWAKGVKAYILMHQKAYQAALELIDDVIAAEPANIWNLDLRAACCRMLGDAEGARAAYTRVLEALHTMPRLSSEDTRTCAFAAYNLGRPDLAISLLENDSSDPAASDDRMRLLGLCYLATGRVARAEELLLGGVARGNVSELDDFLSMDVPAVEAALAASPAIPGALASVRRVKRTAAALLADLRRNAGGDLTADATAELTLLLPAREGAAGRWVEAGARAGAARLQLESGHWQEAARHYRSLRGNAVFPEADAGLERAADGLRTVARQHFEQRRFSEAAHLLAGLLEIASDSTDGKQLSSIHREIGDALWMAGDATGALAEYEKSLVTVPVASEPVGAAGLHTRMALGRQQLGDFAAARASVVEALRLFAEAGQGDSGRALGEAGRPLLRDISHFWQVDAHWTELENDPSTDVTVRRELASARTSLLAYLDDVCHLGEETSAAKTIPIVIPVAMDVGSGLVPLVDPKADGGKLLYEDIPAMRQRIESSTGIQKMPGIRMREDPASQDGYSILLHGAPVTGGRVRIGLRYCLLAADAISALGVVHEGLEEIADPVTDAPGTWCPESCWAALASHGVALFTETQFMLRHVEDVLRQRLDLYLGIQEAEDLIARLTSDGQVAESVRASLGERRVRLLFARVLRALVRERVPLTDWSAILEGARDAGWSSVPGIVRETRLRLKRQLPGNEEGTTLLQVPPLWPAMMPASDKSASVDGFSPETAHRMLLAVREWLLPYTGPVALVANPALRPVIRRLIEYEFASVPVLSHDEVTRPERVIPVPLTAAVAVSQES